MGGLDWVFLNAQSCSWSQKSEVLHFCSKTVLPFAHSRSQSPHKDRPTVLHILLLPSNPLPVSPLLPYWPPGCFLSPRHTSTKVPLLWLIWFLKFHFQTFIWPTFKQPPDIYITTCPPHALVLYLTLLFLLALTST